VLDLLRAGRSHAAGRLSLDGDDEESGSVLDLLANEARSPEEIAAHQERLRLVRACIEGIEVARLKFVEELPDNEIAARCNLTRDAVAGQLKRLRKHVRAVLGAADRVVDVPGTPVTGEQR
jgi:predicted DNA-binding protein (UPF0251 family)